MLLELGCDGVVLSTAWFALAVEGLATCRQGQIVIPVLVSGSPCPLLEAAVGNWGVGVTLGEENGQDNSWFSCLLLTPGTPAAPPLLREGK